MNPFFIFETSVYIIQDIYIIYQKNVDVHIKRYFVNIYIYIYICQKKPYSAYHKWDLGKSCQFGGQKKNAPLKIQWLQEMPFQIRTALKINTTLELKIPLFAKEQITFQASSIIVFHVKFPGCMVVWFPGVRCSMGYHTWAISLRWGKGFKSKSVHQIISKSII